jgi:adenylate kinase family enzyme
MHINEVSRVYIIGSVASGKTTMARNMSKKLNIPWYELDNVVHIRDKNGDRKRTEEERNLEFHKILDEDKWIIEGVRRKYFDFGFESADLIILLDTPVKKRKYRILKRWIFQNLKIEEANYKPTIKMLKCMYKWSNGYEKDREKLLEDIEAYKSKVVIITNSKTMSKEINI